MKKNLSLLAIILIASTVAVAQPDLSYYLPDSIEYDSKIPTPQSILGHEVGEWHVSHDKLVQYMYAIDNASDRVSLEVTGRTHEGRPLLLLTITSPKNHQNIEQLREQHLQLSDPSRSSGLNTATMPAVFYLGCSIHGNEASGSNAGLLMAYHFAAAKGAEIEKALENTIILFDPSFNPDGLHRFSSWVNSRKSKAISPDPADMEHNEAWPGGRTNHYWFDLNRDWLVAQQPESQARIKKFQQWRPNVLTDHHEMGTNATFFFQPGVPSRVHPLTPVKNVDLTKKIAAFHARALDAIGSFYYTQEGYDDFYYGKGSTFPDVQGAIGILFEQASSRGHAQESQNGTLSFAFTIRNQFTTALSTFAAVNDLREELLNHQRQFYRDAVAEAGKDPVKAIVFASRDRGRAFHLAEIVARQKVNIYRNNASITIGGKTYDKGLGYVIPLNQPQYKLIKGMFERRTSFTDSIFYDISSWTLSLATGVEHEEVRAVPALGEQVTEPKFHQGRLVGGKSQYAYAFDPFEYYTPRAMYRLLEKGIRIKVATDPFHHPDGKRFERGSILIPVSGQSITPDRLDYVINQITEHDGIDVYAFNTGLDFKGVSLGSGSFLSVRKPEIVMLVDDGVSSYDAGEIWHLLDTRFQMPMTLMPISNFNRTNLNRYNTLILAPGNYNGISDAAKERLKGWIQNGGTVVGFESAVNWLHGAGLGRFEMKKDGDAASPSRPRPYADIQEYQGAQQTDGLILEAEVDLTNPLLYGYYNPRMPIFKSNNLYMEKAKSAYGNPVVFTSSPLISGYISKQNYAKVKEASVVGVSALGRGRVIGITDNLAFRAFWFGSNKMLMNAIFYGSLLDDASAR